MALKKIMFTVVCLTLLFQALPRPANANSKKASRIASYIGSRDDRGTSVREFSAYSFGVGNLQKSTPASGGGVMGSSIYRGTSTTIRRGGGGGSAAVGHSALLGHRPGTQKAYSAALAVPKVRHVTRGGTSVYLPESTEDPVSQISALAETLKEKREERIEEGDWHVTTLVPDVPGRYQDLMKDAEKAFKEKEYAVAEEDYKGAAAYSEENPGSLLGLAHTFFAVSKTSYTKSARNLRKVFEQVPELPIVDVHPKYFYGDPEDYTKDLGRLEQHIKENPNDPDALFVLAYMKWRDGQPDQTRELLGRVEATAKNEELVAAAEIFRKGMEQGQPEIPTETVEMAEAIDYPSAGIKFALPAGFEIRPLEQNSQIVLAKRDEGTKDAYGFSANAFPAGKGVTADQFLRYLLKNVEQRRPVSDLVIVDEAAVTFNDIKGVARYATYKHSGVDSGALVVCFIREIPTEETDLFITYVFVLESAKIEIESIGPSMARILESVSYTDIKRPIHLPITFTTEPFEDARFGYSVTQPDGWVGMRNERGVVTGRIDYTRGGAASPRVEVLKIDIPANLTSEDCVKMAVEKRVQKGFKVELLSHGESALASKEGYQFSVLKTRSAQEKADEAAPPQTQAGESYIEVSRFILLPSDDETQKLYGIIVNCRDCDVETARGIMEKIASTFRLTAE